MSMPHFPNITPIIDIDREQALTMILASIALEEMGLAHIINAEGERIQFVLNSKMSHPCSITDIKDVNQGVERVIREILKLQMLLQEKLEHVVSLTATHPPPPHVPCSSPCYHPDCPPPKSKNSQHPCCTLTGCGTGCINNPSDFFQCGTATVNANLCFTGNPPDAYSLKYTLCKEKKAVTVSAMLQAIPESIKIRCLNTTPCPSPQEPNILKLRGRGIMVVNNVKRKIIQCMVSFTLTVWDCGCHREFQMRTRSRHMKIHHNSGVVSVQSGNLAIKSSTAYSANKATD